MGSSSDLESNLLNGARFELISMNYCRIGLHTYWLQASYNTQRHETFQYPIGRQLEC